jgi:hypothetical protein
MAAPQVGRYCGHTMIKPLTTELWKPLCSELPGSAPDGDGELAMRSLVLPLTAANTNALAPRSAREPERDADSELDSARLDS